MEALLAAGADKDAKNENGCTAFYVAHENGHLTVAVALLEEVSESEAGGAD